MSILAAGLTWLDWADWSIWSVDLTCYVHHNYSRRADQLLWRIVLTDISMTVCQTDAPKSVEDMFFTVMDKSIKFQLASNSVNLLTTHEAAWYIISVMSVWLSVCLSDDNFQT